VAAKGTQDKSRDHRIRQTAWNALLMDWVL
jgi:hypothetical protein